MPVAADGLTLARVRFSVDEKFPPVRVLDIIRTTLDNALGLEEAKTMELKLTYGWNSTRGGTWNAPNDHAPPNWFIDKPRVDTPSDTSSESVENYLLQEESNAHD